MLIYEFNESNIKGNKLEIPEYIISKIPKNGKLTLTVEGFDEQAEDDYLLELALERKKNDSGIRYSWEEVMAELNITQKEIDEAEADFE